MTQNEFLDTLKKALNGQVASSVVSENLQYYRSYISDEIKKGRSESEIMDELGDPRLIARTIIDAESIGGKKKSLDAYADTFSESTSDSSEENTYGSFHQKSFRINKWGLFGIFFLILFIICCVLYFAFKTVFKLLFSFHGIWFWIIVLLIIYSLSRKR